MHPEATNHGEVCFRDNYPQFRGNTLSEQYHSAAFFLDAALGLIRALVLNHIRVCSRRKGSGCVVVVPTVPTEQAVGRLKYKFAPARKDQHFKVGVVDEISEGVKLA